MNDERTGADPAPAQPGARRYEWLLFDADGTLFDYDRAETSALGQACAHIGVPFNQDCLALYRRINQSLWQALERGELSPGELKVRRFELLLETLGAQRSPADFSEIYLRCLAACPELVDGALEAVQVLRHRHRLAIVTNGLQAVQRGRLARSAIRDAIAEIIISEEIGHAKPAPEFFDVTFARLGHPARSSVLVVGDSWSSDILGAAQYGLDTCWFNPARRARPGWPPITVEVAALRELVEWLG